jgi:hypothetical protein
MSVLPTIKDRDWSSSMPRFFSLLEAEGYLPEVERLITRLKEKKSDYEDADRQLTQIAHRIHITGGMVPPRDQVVELREQKDRAARVLKAMMEKIQGIGCQLKDLNTGLVDFPTLYKGREVYLCWKVGENGITFWHNVEDGYPGRRAIDSDFLANHCGDASSGPG